MSWRCPDHSTDEKPWGCTCLTDRVAGLERDLAAARAEIERLTAGGCARDQRLTQHCALEVQARKELEEARAELADEKATRAHATSARENAERHIAETYESLGVTVMECEEGERLPVLIGRLRAELAEARECLRECIANFGELCAGCDKRWRKAACMDTDNARLDRPDGAKETT